MYLRIGPPTRFGADWPGQRCLIKLAKELHAKGPHKHNGRCSLHGGLSTGAKTADGMKRISDANLKHGRYTKDKLEAQRYAAKVGRKVLSKLKQLSNFEQCSKY